MKPERSQRRRAIKREEKKLSRQASSLEKTWRDAPFRLLFRWILVSSAFALSTLLAVSYLTPLFEVRSISISGAQLIPKSDVQSSLQSLVGANLLQVSDSQVAELLQVHPLIESFAVQAIPPNELLIKIRERQPILRLSDRNAEVLVDVTGMIIEVESESADYTALPLLQVESVETPGEAFTTAVTALLEFPRELYKNVARLEDSSGKSLSFLLREPEVRVIWGGPEEGALKYEVLLSLLANRDEENIEIDLTTPRSPVVRFLDF